VRTVRLHQHHRDGIVEDVRDDVAGARDPLEHPQPFDELAPDGEPVSRWHLLDDEERELATEAAAAGDLFAQTHLHVA
jgi:hypothetical protein